MGNCVSWRRKAGPATAKVVHVDGRLEEYTGEVRAGQVAAGSPGCYVCSSEEMEVGAKAPEVPEAEELKPGELYFMMPLSKSQQPLSLRDLCVLAVTACNAKRRQD